MASRLARRAAFGAAGALALVVAAVGLFLATLDLETYRPRILGAVQNATGRVMGFGTMRLSLGLTPSITVRDLRLANLPGGSQADMLNVGEAELAVGLLPLLSGRIAVRRLVLKAPDILLEEVAGAPNWIFRAAPAAASGGPSQAGPRRDSGLEIGVVEIHDARLRFPGGPEGGVAVARLDASGSGNLRASGALRWGDLPVTFDAQGGTLARLFGAAGPAWPLQFQAELGGARLRAEGELRDPRTLAGWRFDIAAELPRLDALAPLLGRALPPLSGITLQARLSGDGPGLPRLERLRLAMGAATLAPGLALATMELEADAADQPARLTLRGERAGSPFVLTGGIGPLGPALAGGPLGLALSGEHMGYAVTAQGAVAQPLAGTGVALDVTLREPRLGSLAARLSGHGGFFAEGFSLAGIALEGPVAAGAGALQFSPMPVPRLEGELRLQRLDIDAARAALAPPNPPAAGPQPTPPATPAPSPTPAARPDNRLIPSIPLDVAALAGFATDLRLAIATLHLNGRAFRAVDGRLLLADGRARLDPLALTLPGGRVTLRVAADGRANPPQMQISARADALDVAALLVGFGLEPPLSGRGELDIDLRGQGAETRAWAASAIGHIGLALTDGRVQTRVIGRLLPANAQGLAGEVGLACLGARFDVVAGIAQARALFADGQLGRVNGQGQISLRDESLGLRLNTDLRLPIPGTPGLRLRAPVPVSGVLAAPRFDGAGLLGSAVTGQVDRLLPGLGQALGGSGAPGAMSDCGTALAAARGGRAGPVPASQAPAAEAPGGARPQVQDVLRGLLGR